MQNKAGIHPVSTGVLLLLDPIARTQGGIELPEASVEALILAQVRGTVVEVGEDVAIKPWACPGTSVIFRRYAGEKLIGLDNEWYRMVDVKDITGTFDRV
jgi:co-chaperonin GroES (HSP10)